MFIYGCSYRYIATYDGDLYIGAFKSNTVSDIGCKYSYIEGGGLKLGVVNFGIGYFSNKRMEMDYKKTDYCNSVIGEVFVVDDNVSKGNITFK